MDEKQDNLIEQIVSESLARQRSALSGADGPPPSPPGQGKERLPSPRAGRGLTWLLAGLAAAALVLLAVCAVQLHGERTAIEALRETAEGLRTEESLRTELEQARKEAARQTEVMEAYRSKAEEREQALERAQTSILQLSKLSKDRVALWYVLLAQELFSEGDYESSAEALRLMTRYFSDISDMNSLGMGMYLPTEEYYSFQVITMELAGKLRAKGYLSQLESDALNGIFEIQYGENGDMNLGTITVTVPDGLT